MYLYQKDLLPKSFNNLFSRTIQIHNYNTRSSNLYYLPFCRTNIRKFSVNYQAPKFFNTLDCDVRDIASVSLFQIKLKNYLLLLQLHVHLL